GSHEPPCRVRLEGKPGAVARQDDLVEVGEAVVGEREIAQLDPTLLGIDALPGPERNREIDALRVQRLVRRGVDHDVLERALAPVVLDDEADRRHLVRIAEPTVDLAIELAWAVDAGAVEDRNLRGRV